MGKWLFKMRQIKDWILDLLFPKDCLCCQKEGNYLCASCFLQIDFNQKFNCVFCHQETDSSGICLSCRQPDIFLDKVWVATNYNDRKIQALIAGLKYKYITEVSEILARVLGDYLEQHDLRIEFGLTADNCLLVPVPLHAKRFLSRGFNQSALLAEKISQCYNIFSQDLLKRIVNTQSQVHLKRSERQENVANAFVLNSQIDWPKTTKIILLDDVLTTASTLNQCAKVLKQAGYEAVYALVIAQRED